MDLNTIIVYIGCIIFLFIIGRFFILPLKTIGKIVGNSILGGIFIFIINSIGSLFSFHIGLNIGTSLITGILGIPRSFIVNCFKNIFGLSEHKIKDVSKNFWTRPLSLYQLVFIFFVFLFVFF